MKGASMLYNVYAWHVGKGDARLIAEGVDHSTAIDLVEKYLNKGQDWDAYMVPQEEDFVIL